jgi:hypothetical protein
MYNKSKIVEFNLHYRTTKYQRQRNFHLKNKIIGAINDKE